MMAVALLVGCGSSNLWQDAGNGDFSAVQKHINSGADLDARDGLGRTPLYYAVAGDGDPLVPDHEPLEIRFMDPAVAVAGGKMAEPEKLALTRALERARISG